MNKPASKSLRTDVARNPVELDEGCQSSVLDRFDAAVVSVRAAREVRDRKSVV